VYAVIATGGKQERVEAGQRVAVELLGDEPGAEVRFTPLLVVDGERVLVGGELEGSSVAARIVGVVKGPKIRGFTYKPKTNQRRHYGHRQRYHELEILAIDLPGGGGLAADVPPGPGGETATTAEG
jgi:large subunit ribosomal protein L21